MKKIVSILLMAALLFTGITFVPEKSYAASKPADWYFTGSECTSNSLAASTIDYIQAKHPTGSVYKGSGECYGWAEKISKMLSSKRSTKYYTGLRFTKKNLVSKCKGVRAGTHLRVSNEKKFNGYSGHSICLLKVTSSKVYWTDANVGGIYNGIRHKSASIEEFLAQYPFTYINAVTKNLAYKAQSSQPLLTIKRTDSGSGTLYWAKSSSTTKYKIYRATSEKGSYKLIKTTTAATYTDTKAPLGKKYYYKVKAVKKNGRTSDSNKKSFTNKLASPTVTSYTTENPTGSIQISWNPVKNASKYSIYRAVDNNGKLDFKYVGWTKKTTFTDKKVTNPSKWYAYKIRAVYSKNTNGNSLLSEAYGYYRCGIAAPALDYVYDEATNTLSFSWNKPAYAGGYALFYTDTAYGYDMGCGFQTKRTYTFDASTLTPGTTYRFYVIAYEDEYDYWWGNPGSMGSKAVEFTVPIESDTPII